MNFFFRKIPRTKIYIKPQLIMRSLFKTIFEDLKRGQTVKEFEREFAFHYGSKYALAMPFARIALYYLLRALEIEKDSEVLMTPITIPDMVNMIRCVGLRPVFVDLERNTYNVKCEELERKINEKTKVFLLTYLCGFVPDMDRIVDIVKRYNLILIEDCSQNFGSKYKDRAVGTFGEAGFFSTTTLKTCSTFSGGMIISNNLELIKKIENLAAKDLSKPPKSFCTKFIAENFFLWLLTQQCVFSIFTFYLIKILNFINPNIIAQLQKGNIGLFIGEKRPVLRNVIPKNMLYFYTDMQAEVGLEILKTIEYSDKKRIHNAKMLLENLPDVDKSCLPVLEEGSRNTFYRFPIKVKRYENFQKFLFDKHIDTSRSALDCCSTEPVFEMYKTEMKEAEEVMEQSVFIPIHPLLNEDDMKHIAQVVNEYFKINKYQ